MGKGKWLQNPWIDFDETQNIRLGRKYDNNNNNDRLTAFDPGQPG